MLQVAVAGTVACFNLCRVYLKLQAHSVACECGLGLMGLHMIFLDVCFGVQVCL